MTDLIGQTFRQFLCAILTEKIAKWRKHCWTIICKRVQNAYKNLEIIQMRSYGEKEKERRCECSHLYIFSFEKAIILWIIVLEIILIIKPSICRLFKRTISCLSLRIWVHTTIRHKCHGNSWIELSSLKMSPPALTPVSCKYNLKCKYVTLYCKYVKYMTPYYKYNLYMSSILKKVKVTNTKYDQFSCKKRNFDVDS